MRPLVRRGPGRACWSPCTPSRDDCVPGPGWPSFQPFHLLGNRPVLVDSSESGKKVTATLSNQEASLPTSYLRIPMLPRITGTKPRRMSPHARSAGQLRLREVLTGGEDAIEGEPGDHVR